MLPHQSRLVNLNNLLITAYATDDYDNITMTLMRADGQTIKFKYDSRVIIENNPLTTLKVDDFVNIVAAPLSWNNGPLVMFGSSGEVVKVETIPEELKIDFDLNLFAPVDSYGQAGELVLPETGELFNSAITYAFKDAEDANNQYINLETKQVTLPEDEDAEVKLVATFVLGEVTKTKDFIITVKKEGSTSSFATDLFISEYIEGSSYNKAIEIYNGTGEAVDLSNYRVLLFANGRTDPNNTLDLTGTLEHGQTLVIACTSCGGI